MFGFAGKTLRVNLTTGQIRSEPLDERLAEKFIGGMGLAGWLAYKLIDKTTKPLSPDNVLIFSTSPLAGTLAPASSRVHIASRSPNSGFICYTNAGHSAGLMMKYAGYDCLILTGRAEEPVYLRITDDDVEICKAQHLGGRSTWESTDLLRKEVEGHWVDCIGPAAEKLVSFSIILCSKRSSYNKTGPGTVMGSKNLKAIAVKGTKGIKVADPEKFKQLTDEFTRGIVADAEVKTYRTYGAPMHSRPGFPFEEFATRVAERPYACLSCPLACKHLINIKNGPYQGTRYRISHMGALMGHNGPGGPENWDELVKLVERENLDGIEATVTAGILDYLVKCYQNKAISESEIGYIPKKGGEAMRRLIAQTVRREGIGATAAGGMATLIQKTGRDSERYMNHEKWVGRPLALPNEVSTYIIGSLTNPRGAKAEFAHIPIGRGNTKELTPEEIRDFCVSLRLHEGDVNRICHGPEGFNVGRLVKWVEDYSFAYTSMGFCSREPIMRHTNLENLSQIYSAATGIEMSSAKLLEAGERVFNVYKAFNVKMGTTRLDDLPSRGTTWPPDKPLVTEGKDYGTLNQILDEYYDERGWNQNGIPTKTKLASLGLQDIAENIGV
jgi:aldehyde:ferredoxin oxidoreductase